MRRIGQPDRIVVIGGGISGLSSAFYFLREAAARGRKPELTIVDPAERFGGKISTLHRDGFVIERGPDSFLASKKPVIDLAFELGIDQELIGTNPAAEKTYIMHRGKLHPMPPGLMLGIPTEIAPFVKTGILTWGAKLRALMDLVLPAKKTDDDESLGSFLSRRLGPEVMERIAEPLLGGIYAGDLHKLSLQAAFPQFGESERKYGSLIRGMKASRGKTPAAAVDADKLPASARTAFLTFKGGLATMVNALDRSLIGVERRMETKAVRIEPADGFFPGVNIDTAREAERGYPYRVVLSNGETIEADGIVLAMPAYDAADLLEPHIDAAALRAVRYVSVANVTMAFKKETFGLESDGSEFVIPRSEGTSITACTWISAKWPHASPADQCLLRCNTGRAGDEADVDLPDDQLAAAVKHDIRELMGITAEPIFTVITRLHRSMPQYPVCHLQQIGAMRGELAAKLPGVWATGAAFDGFDLPDCIRQGKEAAIRTIEALERR
ncbi:protoporphyrinogen oxidase [Paenibacillus spongiae]|uniref:Coproporphyrinogen III oxidase n=1 Tax=Paenibacillus spongiae TaxID=2909671 RepID=A0ABY5S2V7_9BACL|nr:protoporphyrinogen oxidase [Paenibacillus spongiae]UVI28207.1 protoporphyrinogen oxidase [Paenibacillus spongiae]